MAKSIGDPAGKRVWGMPRCGAALVCCNIVLFPLLQYGIGTVWLFIRLWCNRVSHNVLYTNAQTVCAPRLGAPHTLSCSAVAVAARDVCCDCVLSSESGARAGAGPGAHAHHTHARNTPTPSHVNKNSRRFGIAIGRVCYCTFIQLEVSQVSSRPAKSYPIDYCYSTGTTTPLY